jgi:hypothetical protein
VADGAEHPRVISTTLDVREERILKHARCGGKLEREGRDPPPPALLRHVFEQTVE